MILKNQERDIMDKKVLLVLSGLILAMFAATAAAADGAGLIGIQYNNTRTVGSFLLSSLRLPAVLSLS